MNLEEKTKEELIDIIKTLSEKFKYYKSEWENVTRLCVSKNRDLTALKKENTKLRKELEGK